MNRTVLVVGALIVVPLLVFLALGFGHDPNVLDSPLIGHEAPGFSLDSFEGDRVSLEALRGTPVVLNFWASWCQPCVYEHPLLAAAAQTFEGRVRFIGVVPPEDRPEAVAAFTARLGAWGPTYHDVDGQVAIAYGVFKLPETYFVDADGVIVYKHAGPLDPDSLRSALEAIL
ncbi:MAG: redoxin domain-containing protein [Thermoanaerobaculia bacterium]|nr:redoxin domain-containing protein [Thermoanaerobaculia bacterium]